MDNQEGHSTPDGTGFSIMVVGGVLLTMTLVTAGLVMVGAQSFAALACGTVVGIGLAAYGARLRGRAVYRERILEAEIRRLKDTGTLEAAPTADIAETFGQSTAELYSLLQSTYETEDTFGDNNAAGDEEAASGAGGTASEDRPAAPDVAPAAVPQGDVADIPVRAVVELFARSGHAFRTPLNAIINYTELVGETVEEEGIPGLEDDIARVLSASRHLLDLITDIVDIARIDAGRMSVSLEEIGVTTTIQEAMEELTGQIRASGTTIMCNVPETVTATADGELLRRAIAATLDALLRQGRQMEIAIDAQMTAPTPALVLTMHQPGMTRDFLDHTFGGALRPVDANEAIAGAAPGYAIAARFAAGMQGDLWVGQKEAVGTRLELRLPLKGGIADGADIAEPLAADFAVATDVTEDDEENAGDDVAVVNTAASTAAPAVETDAANPALRTILVVDDDPVVRDIANRCLDGLGFRIVSAETCEEGLAIANQSRPDLIFLDLNFEGMGGLEFLSLARASETLKTVPILVASVVDDITPSLDAGANGHIVKPFNRTTMRNEVCRLTEEKPSHVLIIEDDRDTNALLTRIGENAGLKVTSVHSASEAIMVMRNQDFDAVTLDFGLPDMNGISFLKRMRRNEALREVPVLVLTGRDLSPEETTILDELATSVHQKTKIPIRELMEGIVPLLRHNGRTGLAA